MRVGRSEQKTERTGLMEGIADRIIIAAVAFSLIPILVMFNASFSVMIDSFIFGRRGQSFSGLMSYVYLLRHTGFGDYVKNSLVLCALSIVLALALAIPAAYALSRYKFRGLNMFGILVVVPLLIPTISYFLPFAVTINEFEDRIGIKFYNSYNGYIILAIMYAVMYLPFSIWVIRGFMFSVPVDIEEAARVDGCSTFGVFMRILLPLMSSGIIVTAVLHFMLVWDERLLVDVLMTDEKFRTVALWPSYDNMKFVSGPLSGIPILVIFFLVQKKFMKGITGGALKE
ncbi:MAG: carbohydrate ABC transporter permease [Bacillota bacterium]